MWVAIPAADPLGNLIPLFSEQLNYWTRFNRQVFPWFY